MILTNGRSEQAVDSTRTHGEVQRISLPASVARLALDDAPQADPRRRIEITVSAAANPAGSVETWSPWITQGGVCHYPHSR